MLIIPFINRALKKEIKLMANIVPIKKAQHQNLKLSEKRNLAHVAEQHIAPVTATEFSKAASSFPIVLIKEPEKDRYRSVVMLGLQAGENLFYKNEEWLGLYIPQSIVMAPFMLGVDPDKEKTLTACIDLDSPFVGEDKDLPLFDEKGEETELLKNVQQSLGRLYENEVMTDKFIKELLANELLQELELNIKIDNGENKKLVGIYTVNEEKLAGLSEDKVLDFHKRGLFVPIYSMLGSLSQVNRLVKQRNDSSGDKVSGIQIIPINAEDKK